MCMQPRMHNSSDASRSDCIVVIVSAFECRNAGRCDGMGVLEKTALDDARLVVTELAAALFLGP